MKRTGNRKTNTGIVIQSVRILLASSILLLTVLFAMCIAESIDKKSMAYASSEIIEVRQESTESAAQEVALTSVATNSEVEADKVSETESSVTAKSEESEVSKAGSDEEADPADATTLENKTDESSAILNAGTSNGSYRADNLLKNESTKADYKITVYENAKDMYATDRVNIRTGAGTEYDKLGVIARKTKVSVLGQTENGWYQVMYDGRVGYILGEYLNDIEPGISFIFAGDSRTVQMSEAVRKSEYKWIAKVGEGYSFFSSEAVPQIDVSVGNGSVIIINYGVNDLHNADKYIKLVNKKVDSWIAAGATVYYAAVTPVRDYPTITNADIESFNSQMRSGLDSRIGWLDGYSYLQNNGFTTGDGLHYNYETYKSLYMYYMNQVAAQKEA